MSIEYYMLHAATAIAQIPPQGGEPVVYVPVNPGKILRLFLPGLIFVGLWAGAWWRILSRVGYEGKLLLFWLIGLVLFPINAIVVMAFALLPWPNSTEPRSTEPESTEPESTEPESTEAEE